jgi:hypothetical protein
LCGIDAAGNPWLFGGDGYDSSNTNNLGYLNDLWMFSKTSNQWIWVSGSNIAGDPGMYTSGALVPAARDGATGGIDPSGNFWVFGSSGKRNDLWRYNPGSGQWTWMSGSPTLDTAGVYGTQGVATAGDAPGAREGSVSWIDGSGNFWMFGGNGITAGFHNDLWKFVP